MRQTPTATATSSPATAAEYAALYRTHDVNFFQALIDRGVIVGVASAALAPVIELESRGAA